MEMTRLITYALWQIRPNSEWVLRGDDYSGLEWLDVEQSKPSWEEIENAINNPIPKVEPTVTDKLASVGLSLDDLKTALGL